MEGQLTITVKDGTVSVVGPIENPLLCYAMLAAARDVVFMKAQEDSKRAIVTPPPGFDPKATH